MSDGFNGATDLSYTIEIDWNEHEQSDWPGRAGHTSIVFNNKLWVLGGEATSKLNEVWYTTNGSDWTQCAIASWSERSGHTSVVFDNGAGDKIWVIGGSPTNNEIWYTNNGQSWTQSESVGWSARYAHTSIVFDNKMWVMGGDPVNSEVWYTSDGDSWTQCTDASWPVRRRHSSVVHDNKIWIMGGYSSSNSLNDVWYTLDGQSWTQSTGSADWPVRSDHSSVVYRNRIWLLGGFENGYKNDIWYTLNGESWTKYDAPTWTPRGSHSTVLFDGGIWVLGGDDTSGKIDEVWSTREILQLNWTKGDEGTTGYIISRSISGTDFGELDTLSPEATSYRDPNYIKGNWYKYRITTLGPNDATDEIDLEVEFKAPTGLSVSVDGFDFTLTWNTIECDKYYILDDKGNELATVTTDYWERVGNVEFGRQVCVVAEKDGILSPPSIFLSVVTIPNAPTNLLLEVLE